MLLVEGQDLQLGREVDLAERDALGHRHDRGREVEDGADTGGDQPFGHLLCDRGGGGEDGVRSPQADGLIAISAYNVDVERPMVVSLRPEIEKAVQRIAQDSGKSPDDVVNEALGRGLLQTFEPIARGGGDEWMRRLRSIASPAGVSLSDDAVSRDSLYED